MNDYINIALPKGRLGEKVYALLESTGWADIQQHTTKEIMEKVKELRSSSEYGSKQYNTDERDKLRAEYRARRKKVEARIALSKG